MGRAEAKRIDAQATADYEKLVEAHLNDAMLRWQEIEAMRALGASPNSKLLFFGNGGHATGTMLELK